jgi:hemerythrin
MIWKEEYKIGVALIDKQHEELFSRVTAFVETVQSDKIWNEKMNKVNDTLEYMKDYVVTHFQEEEAYQKEIGYPEAEQHRKKHQDMISYIRMIAGQNEINGCKEIVMQQFAGRIVTWLVNHVVGEDHKVAEFTKNR